MLNDIRVLELTGGLGHAICGKLLADFGARVILLEPPGCGAELRHQPPFADDQPGPDRGCLFLHTAAGKLSLTLDCFHPDGRALFERLLASATLVIDNGDLSDGRLKIDWRRINPALVVLHLHKPAGAGERGDILASHLEVGALSGWMAQLGEPGRTPILTNSIAMSGFVPGVIGASAALSAAMRAQITGEGRHVEISEREALLFATRYNETYFSYTGAEIKRCGRSFSGWTPTYRIFDASDGYVSCAASTDAQVELMMALTGIDGERFAEREARYAHGEELVAAMNQWTSERTRDQVFHEAQAWRIPMGKVATVDEVFDYEQLNGRDFFCQLDHPVVGRRTYPATPAMVDGARVKPARHAPLLGEHNAQILCDELGLSRTDLEALAKVGVI